MSDPHCRTCQWMRPSRNSMIFHNAMIDEGMGRCVFSAPPPAHGPASWPEVWIDIDVCGEHPDFRGRLADRLKAIRVRILEARIDQALKRSDIFTANNLGEELAVLIERAP